MMILEQHGIADAQVIKVVSGDKQGVYVTDRPGGVMLSMSTSYPAGLSPKQARMLAAELIASADRCEGVQAKPKSKVPGRSKGGVARAQALSPEERKAISQKAAAARWNGRQDDAERTPNSEPAP